MPLSSLCITAIIATFGQWAQCRRFTIFAASPSCVLAWTAFAVWATGRCASIWATAEFTLGTCFRAACGRKSANYEGENIPSTYRRIQALWPSLFHLDNIHTGNIRIRSLRCWPRLLESPRPDNSRIESASNLTHSLCHFDPALLSPHPDSNRTGTIHRGNCFVRNLQF
jgi:hypothetical protein